MRAGARVLLMAADPIKRRILQEMAAHPLQVGEGEYRVTPEGKEALFVGFVVERWLQSAPQGPLLLDTGKAQRAVTALAEGWSATVMHTLAREPLTFDELGRAIDGLGPRALRRHLEAMQSAGQVEAHSGGSEGTIYTITDWLRAGIAPLIASARVERRDPKEGMAPIDALDVEAGFLCSLSLLELPQELSGVCRLGINLAEDESSSLTGVTAQVSEGRIISCKPGLDQPADAWAAASAGAWLDTVIEPEANLVRTGGDGWLTRALLDALHETLFGVPVA